MSGSWPRLVWVCRDRDQLTAGRKPLRSSCVGYRDRSVYGPAPVWRTRRWSAYNVGGELLDAALCERVGEYGGPSACRS
jgi:hypothetical protein